MKAVKPELRLLTFEKCAHCKEVYFFYVEVKAAGIPYALYTFLPARSKPEAFFLLVAIRMHSRVPITDAKFNRWRIDIDHSTLPERMPDNEALRVLRAMHLSNPQVMSDLNQTLDLLRHSEHGGAPHTIN